ncbi:putative LRR receptor-like serine/threonine-protein kinase [Hordeum vulgare]|nr:putative LRR receptor-like serine/threonine-protein kinase [Hordeum vulgare]
MKHLHYVLSYTCLLLCATVPVRADVRREAEALVNWKASLDGADESLGSWSMANSTSLCRWTYITCNSAGLMTELNLNTSLNGTLERLDFSAFPHLENSSFKMIKNQDTWTMEEVLQPGKDMLAVGYYMYGRSWTPVPNTGNGVNGFTLDPSLGQFIMTHPSIEVGGWVQKKNLFFS